MNPLTPEDCAVLGLALVLLEEMLHKMGAELVYRPFGNTDCPILINADMAYRLRLRVIDGQI